MTHAHGAEPGILCGHVLRRGRPLLHVCAFEDFAPGMSMDGVPVGWKADRSRHDGAWITAPLSAAERQEYLEE
ncbi:hypothetical protein HKCCE2091_15455 [Rhodobacterales bacterium HKCCE2091]|nr:hypothetical protein [Rhodobacterales bacterium HKCCE2091]